MFITALSNDFREQPRSVETTTGSDVQFDCRAPRGEPDPRIRWRKDNEPVKARTPQDDADDTTGLDPRLMVTEAGSLRIAGVTRDDAGVYVCVAYNVAGERESSPARLSIRGMYLL